MKVVHESFGIVHGAITTLHDVTNTQVVVDGFKSDRRRARSCLQSLIPTTTGSARANGPLQGILGDETRPLVSVDYVNDPRSAIVDGLSTLMVNGTQLKVYAWYDNEWGYSSRLADLVSHGARLDAH